MMKSPLGEVFKVPEDNRKELESLNKYEDIPFKIFVVTTVVITTRIIRSLNDYISMVQNLDSSWQGGIIIWIIKL